MVEGLTGRRVEDEAGIRACFAKGEIPVIVDPDLAKTRSLQPVVIVDARLKKQFETDYTDQVDKLIGLGPGFSAGENCLAVIETNRGPDLGRVIWHGRTEPDTGRPEQVQDHSETRVLRAPAAGRLATGFAIKDTVRKGEIIATIGDAEISAAFDGVVRGLLVDGTQVKAGMKVGDLDPRGDAELAVKISDKALAVGGGVVEAVVGQAERRKLLLG
jgi:xanthine dehydrogenase accessory factor